MNWRIVCMEADGVNEAGLIEAIMTEEAKIDGRVIEKRSKVYLEIKAHDHQHDQISIRMEKDWLDLNPTLTDDEIEQTVFNILK